MNGRRSRQVRHPRLRLAAPAAWAMAAALTLLVGCSSSPSPGRVATADAVPRAEAPTSRGNPDTYKVLGKRYRVRDSNAGFRQRGVASWYGTKFHGRPTSSGEPYDMYEMTAAHKSLRLPAYVRVTNLENGKSVIVRVNDRGPFVGNRVIDLSYAAAHKIDMTAKGTARVDIEVVGPGQRQAAQSGQIGRSEDDDGRGERNWGRDALPNARWGENVFVQIGAFSDAGNAHAVRSRLDRAGIAPVTTEAGHLTRVRVGPLASQNELDAVIDRLRRLGFYDAKMVVK